MSNSSARSSSAALSRTAIFVVVVAAGMNLMARGFGETYTVFLLPLQESFGWSRAELTSIYSIHMFSLGMTAPLAGWVFDRFGPRVAYSIGLLAAGAGYYFGAGAQSLWELQLFVGVIAGYGGAAIGIVAAAALVRRWYSGGLGTAIGIAYAGLGMGVMVMVPVAQLLIQSQGWRGAYQRIGLFALCLVPLIQLIPWARLARGAPHLSHTTNRGTTSGFASLQRAMANSAFWGMFNVYLFTSICIYVCNVQVVAFLIERGFEPLLAASAFGAAGMLSIIGIVFAGVLTDRFGRLPIATLTFVFSIGGIVCLIAIASYPVLPLLISYVVLLGAFQGARGPIVSTLASDIYGGPGYGAIFGAISLGMGIGAASGAWISGWLHDLTGDYVAGFALGIVAGCIALGQFVFVPALRHAASAKAVDT